MTHALHTISSLAAGRFVVDEHAFLRLSFLFFKMEDQTDAIARILSELPAGCRDVLTESAARDVGGDGSSEPDVPAPYISALDSAVKDGKPWAIRALAATLDPNHRPPGFEPLFFPALRRGDEMALALLSTGRVDLEIKGRDGLTPLAFAAAHSRIDVMRELISLGAKTNAAMAIDAAGDGLDATGGATALMVAAKLGRVDAIHLLAPLSDVATVDDEGRDALEHAREGRSPRAPEAIAVLSAYLLAATERASIGEAALSGSPEAPSRPRRAI